MELGIPPALPDANEAGTAYARTVKKKAELYDQQPKGWKNKAMQGKYPKSIGGRC